MRVDEPLRLLILLFAGIVLLAACTTQAPLDELSEDAPVAVTKAPPPLKAGATGKMLAGACFGCHGPEGRSRASAIPSLAGLPEGYFINVMQAYQYGGRYASVMGRIAQGFEGDEIARMASYFSRLQVQPKAQRVKWRLVSKGRQLHRRYCLECHGDLTHEPSKDANLLHGQWMDYLRWTLQDYMIGINQADPEMAEQLAGLVRRHGSDGLEALLNYLASARP